MLLLRQHPDTDAALQAVGSMLVRATTMMTLKGGSLLTILLVLSGHGHSLGLTWVYFGGFFVLLVHQFGQRAGSCFVLRGYTTSTFLHPPCIPLQRGGCYICLTCKWFYSQKVESEQDGKLERQKVEYGHFRFWEAIFFSSCTSISGVSNFYILLVIGIELWLFLILQVACKECMVMVFSSVISSNLN